MKERSRRSSRDLRKESLYEAINNWNLKLENAMKQWHQEHFYCLYGDTFVEEIKENRPQGNKIKSFSGEPNSQKVGRKIGKKSR